MAQFFRKDDFCAEAFGEGALHVYSDDPSQSTSLIVLIHGLGGSGYGTWGEIPSHLLKNDSSDVAIFDYVSGARRRVLNSPSVESVIQQLVDELESLDHESIHLVGHSMGGLIAMGAVREASERNLTVGSPLLPRLRSLFTLASPLAGSRWVPRVLIPMKERTALALHSKLQQENAKFFANRVNVDLALSPIRSLWIPHYAAKAMGDRFVDPFSSAGTIPSERSRTFKGGHSEFLRGQEVAEWVALKVLEVERLRTKAVRSSPLQPTLRTAFEGHSLRGEWVDSYQEAISNFMASEEVQIQDMTGQPITQPIELFVRVLEVRDAESGRLHRTLQRGVYLQERELVRALGVSIFGPSSREDSQRVAQALGHHPNRWVSPSVSLSALQQEITLWLKRVYKLAPLPGVITNSDSSTYWAADRSERDLIEEP